MKSRAGARSVGVLLAFVAMLTAREALAERVAIVASKRDEVLAQRLTAELEHLGFSVARASSVEANDGAAAIVSITNGELRVFEKGSLGIGAPSSLPTTEPVKAAEHVRALLLPAIAITDASMRTDPTHASEASAAEAREAQQNGPPRQPPLETTPPLVSADDTSRKISSPQTVSPLDVAAALGGAATFGGMKPGAALTGSLTMFPRAFAGRSWQLGLGLAGSYQAIAESVSSERGSSESRMLGVGPEIVLAVPFGGSGWSSELAAGVWVHHLQVTGEAKAPFTARDDSAWTWSPTGRARVQRRLFASVSAYAEARIGRSIPTVEIRFDRETVSEWGAPWAHAGGGLSARF